MLKVLDLFSGIGGFSLGLEATGGFETVAFCECEDYPRKILAKHWPDVPIFNDVRTLDYDGPVDVISGGYPCQPFSLAGVRKGKEDDRHLWPSMLELIKKHRPTWVVGENVFGHVSMGLDQVLSDLEAHGYAARPFVIPACAVDAHHRRDRVWIIAHSNSNREPDGPVNEQERILAHPNNQPGEAMRGKCSALTETGQRREYDAPDGGGDVERQRPVFGSGEVAGKDVPNAGRNRRLESTDGVTVKTDRERRPEREQGRPVGEPHSPQATADTDGQHSERGIQHVRADKEGRKVTSVRQSEQCGDWRHRGGEGGGKSEPGMGGMVDGLPGGLDGYWLDEPDHIPRVAVGVTKRIDRLKCLGNAVVPQVVERIGQAILDAHNETS